MRILFLSPRQCWPAESGAKLREYYLARALGERSLLTHISYSAPDMKLSFCRRMVAVPPVRGYTPGKIMRGLVGRWPLPVLNYTSPNMHDALAGVLREESFDLVHLDSIHMAAYADWLHSSTGAPVVYDWHNIESEAMQRYSRHTPSFLRARYAGWTARRLASLEDRVLRQAFGHIVCSERERLELLRRVPSARVALIDNGVDAAYFASAADSPTAGRRRLVFVGAMSYHANIDAAIFFAREVWPAISRRFPQWILTLVGSNPSPAVRALQSGSVEVTGTVDDVRPYYGQAFAAVVPLRIGGGTRLKILEAMAAGVPAISTSLGAEGLALSPGVNILTADNPRDWLPHLETLFRDPRLWAALSTAGRELARARYDWEMLGARLYDTYSGWAGAA